MSHGECIQNVRAALGPSGRGQQSGLNREVGRTMGGQRTHRLVFVALALLFAGLLAVPAKLAPSPERTRIAAGEGPSLFGRHDASTQPIVLPPPAPVVQERPLQAPDDPWTDDTAPVFLGEPAVVPEVRDRPPIERAPTTEAAKTVFGVIIGVNDYPGSAADLSGAVNDARDMADALALYGVPAENVRLLLDGAATTPAINDALSWIVTTAQPDSTVVLFYAGHVRKLEKDTEAIVGADGAVLPDWYLGGQLSALPAEDVWIVMAACYGGGFTELMAPGRVLTAAADANSLAYENQSFGRSYLDEYLINQALLQRKSAGPTAQDAFAYAQAGLERDYPNRTLTQIDLSTSAISLDGVDRDRPPGYSTGPGPNPTPPPQEPTVPPPDAPPAPPSTPPPPCQNLLGLLCPPDR